MKSKRLLVPMGIFLGISSALAWADNKAKDTTVTSAATAAAKPAPPKYEVPVIGDGPSARAWAASHPHAAFNGNPPSVAHLMAQRDADEASHAFVAHIERRREAAQSGRAADSAGGGATITDSKSKDDDYARQEAEVMADDAKLRAQAEQMTNDALAKASASSSVAGARLVSGNDADINTKQAKLPPDVGGHHSMGNFVQRSQDLGPDETDRSHHSMDSLF